MFVDKYVETHGHLLKDIWHGLGSDWLPIYTGYPNNAKSGHHSKLTSVKRDALVHCKAVS